MLFWQAVSVKECGGASAVTALCTSTWCLLTTQGDKVTNVETVYLILGFLQEKEFSRVPEGINMGQWGRLVEWCYVHDIVYLVECSLLEGSILCFSDNIIWCTKIHACARVHWYFYPHGKQCICEKLIPQEYILRLSAGEENLLRGSRKVNITLIKRFAFISTSPKLNWFANTYLPNTRFLHYLERKIQHLERPVYSSPWDANYIRLHFMKSYGASDLHRKNFWRSHTPHRAKARPSALSENCSTDCRLNTWIMEEFDRHLRYLCCRWEKFPVLHTEWWRLYDSYVKNFMLDMFQADLWPGIFVWKRPGKITRAKQKLGDLKRKALWWRQVAAWHVSWHYQCYWLPVSRLCYLALGWKSKLPNANLVGRGRASIYIESGKA